MPCLLRGPVMTELEPILNSRFLQEKTGEPLRGSPVLSYRPKRIVYLRFFAVLPFAGALAFTGAFAFFAPFLPFFLNILMIR